MPFAMGTSGASRVCHRSTWEGSCNVVGALSWMGTRRPDSDIGDVFDWERGEAGKLANVAQG